LVFGALTAAAVLAGSLSAPFQAAAAGRGDEGGSARLAAQLRNAITGQQFQNVIDLNPLVASAAAAATPAAREKYDPDPATLTPQLRAATAPALIHQMPNVDAMVIELDRDGRPTAAADVLLTPHDP